MSAVTPDSGPWVDTPSSVSVATASETQSRQRTFRSKLVLITVFWIYVALSNVMYATSLQGSLSQKGLHGFFAPWDMRLLQHLLLYPMLIAAVCLSSRVEWKPLWRAIPLQVICGLAFASLGSFMMDIAGLILDTLPWREASVHGMDEKNQGSILSTLTPHMFTWLSATTNFFLSYAFCIALLTGFDFYRRLRDVQLRSAALERSLSVAQLTALRMQLSPHTLFNLLHTIRGNISWDPSAAQSMVVQLGELLRRLLRAGEQELSRLDDEMESVRLYLELQRKRFEDRLSVSVADASGLANALIPSLILQPLIENAVTHGLANHRGLVNIRVDIESRGDLLVLRVVNSRSNDSFVPESARNGIGLRNVRERLKLQFADQATFSSDPKGDKWVAEIQIPLLHSLKVLARDNLHEKKGPLQSGPGQG